MHINLFPALKAQLAGRLRRPRDEPAPPARQVCALTERRRTGRRRDSDPPPDREFRLGAVAQAAGVGVFDLDFGGAGDYFSPELRAMAGLPQEPAELTLAQFLKAVHPEDRERMMAEVKASRNFGDGGEFEDIHRLVWPDGTMKWVRAKGRTFFADGGAPLGSTGIVIDITDSRLAQAELERSSVRLAAILDSLTEGVVIFDLEGLVTSMNPAALRLLRYRDVAEARLRLPEFAETFELFSMDGRSLSLEEWPLGRVLRGESFSDYEVEVRRRDDGTSTIISYNGTPVRDAAGVGILGVLTMRDVTDRKATEARIRNINAELEQRVAERTAELQRANDALLLTNMELRHFAHAVAHDLQTPLRSIAGFAQLMQQEVKGLAGDRVDEWASLVIDNARRLQTLIQELLAYTRLDIQGLPFEKVDLCRLFDEAAASLAGLIDHTGAEVACHDLPTLSVDRTQIAQLLQNLIENGIKYNRSKPPKVSIACERQGDDWVFSVTDNGIGIDPRHQERIFEIFRRLHSYSHIPGTGIGLALCRRIVERHGGRIWVSSRPGEGSTFYFTLPLRPEES